MPWQQGRGRRLDRGAGRAARHARRRARRIHPPRARQRPHRPDPGRGPGRTARGRKRGAARSARCAAPRAGCGARSSNGAQRLLELSAEAEVAIDYADEEDGACAFDPAPRLAALVDRDRRLACRAARRAPARRRAAWSSRARPMPASRASSTRWRAKRARSSPRSPARRATSSKCRWRSGDPAHAGRHRRAARVRRGGRAHRHRPRRARDRARRPAAVARTGSRPARRIRAPARRQQGRLSTTHRRTTVSRRRRGEGMDDLKDWIADQAPSARSDPRNNRRSTSGRRACSTNAATRLQRARSLRDPVLIAEELRLARTALDRVSGISGVEQLLDALFGRFCLGK